MTGTGKRQRGASPDDHLSDADAHAAGPAERKRELERNRRNLVNVRFQELERTLGALPGAPQRVQRRLDKEVVLKEAAQRLSSQQRDLDVALARLAAMSEEMHTLRTEKVELRQDKQFLHKEVAIARAENSSLAADNVALWEYVQKSPVAAKALDGLPMPRMPSSHRAHAQGNAVPSRFASTGLARAKVGQAAEGDIFGQGSGGFAAAMLQYPFDEQQRDMSGFDGLDDVGQMDMPDIAPCA